MIDYNLMSKQIRSLADAHSDHIAVFANASALLYESLEDINWAGFYLVKGSDLLLGPFQGKVACVVIEKGKGVCGTAWEKDETQLVANVHEFPGHIACDAASNSEIVIPVHSNGDVVAVLDIDSPSLNRFSKEDKDGLELFVRTLEEVVTY